MENNSHFVKNGNVITPKPAGSDYNLKAGDVYRLVEDKYTDLLYITEDKAFEFPKRYYSTKEDDAFATKVINTFNKTEKLTTGVLLSGMKGSGKTLMAKKIAEKSKLPIIVVDKDVRATDIENFFAQMSIDVCVIFDEIDKYWNSRYLLGFLDGVKPSCKKLVICTANEEKEIDEYLNDRCSRVRYKRAFNALSKQVVSGVLNDIIKDKKKAEAATEFIINNIRVVSYDNVIIFGEEVKNNPDESFESIIADLNVEKKD